MNVERAKFDASHVKPYAVGNFDETFQFSNPGSDRANDQGRREKLKGRIKELAEHVQVFGNSGEFARPERDHSAPGNLLIGSNKARNFSEVGEFVNDVEIRVT